MNIKHTPYLTLILLCFGYFIDFYDLSVMGSSYNELIKEQFHIINTVDIQRTYLLISNFQTAGIFIGAILFGFLGDKIGRAHAIRYSVLVYSIATILAVYTHSLNIFILLRVIAYIGLASEFATSTVLILELFPLNKAAWGSAWLYSCGVLGGICATLISFFSWKVMFWLGGIGGLLLYFARGQIQESKAFLNIKKTNKNNTFENIRQLFLNKHNLAKLIKYFVMILPFYAIITMMFIFPSYIVKKDTLAHATKLLLIGFFCGNILSSFLSAIINNYFKTYKTFLFTMLIVFLGLMLSFSQVNEVYLFIYSLGLGFIGGGYPVSWAQQLALEFPVLIRSLASNCLFALGRASSIGFNSLISIWLANGTFKNNALILIILIFIISSISVYFSPNNYQQKLQQP